MSEAKVELDLSDDEKVALGNILYGNQNPFGTLGPKARQRYLDKFDAEYSDGGVNRGLNADSFMGDDTGPKVTHFEEFETSISEDDNGPYSKAFVVLINDKVVIMHVSYPESSDDDEGGTFSDYDVRPAAELADAIRSIKRGIAADAVRLLADRVGNEDVLELLMEAMLARQAKTLAPSAG